MPFPSPTFAFLDVSGGEMIVIMLIVLVFFGGEKLPGFARGLGKLLRELKRMASGVEQEIKRAMEEPPPPRTRVINPPDDADVPTPDPTPGHRIMADPLPVEPATDAAADAATALPPDATAPAPTETPAISTEVSAPAAKDSVALKPAPTDKPIGG
jgi:sec-independent protein translocase protein TatA